MEKNSLEELKKLMLKKYRKEVIFGSDEKAKGMEYMRKDSISINDSTLGRTVKLESQVVGNPNYELSKKLILLRVQEKTREKV